MASQLIPTTAPQPQPDPYSAFAAPNPYLAFGDMLTGFGEGMLSQGPSLTPISPFQAVGAGAQGAQAGINQAYQQNQMRQQNILARQAFQKGQQDLAAGNLNMASTLMMMNLRRQRMGLPPISADDLAGNPSLSLGDPLMGAPAAQGSSGSSTPSTQPQPGATSSGAASPGQGTGSQPTGPVPGMPTSQGDPYGLVQATQDAWLDPKLARAEIEGITASPQYQQAQAMWKLGLVQDQNGVWRNQDGSVASQAQLAAAVEAGKAWADVGPANAKTAFDRSVTPITQTVPVLGPDGKTVVGYQQINTNQYAAATRPTAGAPVVDPTNPTQVAQLAAAGSSGQAAGAAPYDLVQVDVPNPTIPGSTIKTYMTKADAIAYAGGNKGAQPGNSASGPQFPQGNAGGSYGQKAQGAQPQASAPGQQPQTPGIPGQVTLGPADQAMLPDLVKGIADRQSAAASASDALVNLGELRKALNGLPTGPGTENANEAAAAFSRLGIDINSMLPAGLQADPVKYAIAKKNINLLGMALARSNFPGGRITNTDVNLALTATPNFFNTPGANKELLNNIEAMQRLKIDRAQFDTHWVASHGGQPSLQMEQDWRDKVQGMKNVPDLIKQAYLGFGDQAARPSAPQPPQIILPPGAINYGYGPNKEIYYQFPNPNGPGYIVKDAKGNVVQ